MPVSLLDVWQFIAIVAGAVAAGDGLKAALRYGYDYFRGRFFPPQEGPTQKQLLESLHSQLGEMRSQLAEATATPARRNARGTKGEA